MVRTIFTHSGDYQYQLSLFKFSEEIEELAQNYAAQIIQAQHTDRTDNNQSDYRDVNADSLEMFIPPHQQVVKQNCLLVHGRHRFQYFHSFRIQLLQLILRFNPIMMVKQLKQRAKITCKFCRAKMEIIRTMIPAAQIQRATHPT